MKGAFVSLCLLVAVFVSVNSPFAQEEEIGSGGWEQNMSPLKSQYGSTGPACETYSAVHAMEGLYNYLFGLTANKISLDPNSVVSGATPGGVFDSIHNDGCKAEQELNSFPNYDNAVYKLTGKSDTETPTLQWMETYIQQAPICIKCRCYDSIKSTVETSN